MSAPRTAVLVAVLLLAGAAAFWWTRPAPRPATPPTVDGPTRPVASPTAPVATPAPTAQPATVAPAVAANVPPAERSHLADRLNAPDGTIQQDLQIVEEVLGAWRSNFHGLGNPVGENREITAALAGKNRLGFAFIPADHSAINREGELCDRWGTPFFFHQISGSQMEIHSAGPDRKVHTADDVVIKPERAPAR